MKIFCCQMDIAWENKATNFAKAQTLIAEAKVPAGSLVVLPEMFATGFSMDVAAIAESASANPAPGSRNGKEFNASETADFLAGTARKFNIYVVGGLVTAASGARGRNQAADSSQGRPRDAVAISQWSSRRRARKWSATANASPSL